MLEHFGIEFEKIGKENLTAVYISIATDWCPNHPGKDWLTGRATI
jgi:hypothetical protein